MCKSIIISYVLFIYEYTNSLTATNFWHPPMHRDIAIYAYTYAHMLLFGVSLAAVAAEQNS